MLQSIGLVVVCLGIIGLVWGIFQKLKAGRVSDAPFVPTANAARGLGVGPKRQISAQGNVTCHGPLIAPFSGKPCLYYRIKCTAEWKEGETTKTKELDDQKVAAQFSIDDGSGAVFVDAREGGDFEPTEKRRETKGTGLLGGITGTEIMFGSYRVHTGALSLGTKYTVEEELMPVVPRVYACGKLSDHGAIAAPGWRQLILSTKSRDDLLSSATKGAKLSLLAGAAAFVVGSGLAVVGQLTAGPEEAQVAPAKTSTTKTTAAPVPKKK
jgi:hypothetical protein